jgi:hypothetical protein
MSFDRKIGEVKRNAESGQKDALESWLLGGWSTHQQSKNCLIHHHPTSTTLSPFGPLGIVGIFGKLRIHIKTIMHPFTAAVGQVYHETYRLH